MKKETRIFLIILIGWLSLLNFAILKTIIQENINSYKAIIVKNLVSGAAVYYPLNTNSLFSVLIAPLFVFNALVIIFLSLSYYFWIKSKKHVITRKQISGKKGQSAMEFLMTYGWAIMAFIISIAALMYFNVLKSPTGQSVCALSPGFNCKDFVVGESGVALVIQNALRVNIREVTVNITNSAQGPCIESKPPKDLDNDEADTFFVPCLNINTIGTTFKGDIVIKYRKENSALSSTTTGLITTKVQDYKYNDTEAPIIVITEPINNQNYNTLFFNLVYEIIDFSSVTCWYRLDNGNNVDLPNCQDQYNINSKSAGIHTLTLFARDVKNNGVNKTVSFTTSGTPDTQAPTWSNPNIAPTPVQQNNLVTFNTTWTDNIWLAGFILSVNQGSSYVNYSYTQFSGITNIASYKAQITASTGTLVRWRYYAYDTSDNMASSDIRQFTVGSGSDYPCPSPECGPAEEGEGLLEK